MLHTYVMRSTQSLSTPNCKHDGLGVSLLSLLLLFDDLNLSPIQGQALVTAEALLYTNSWGQHTCAHSTANASRYIMHKGL